MFDSRLTLHALCVAQEALEDASRGPVAPSFGLRVALGYLARGRQRRPFLEFYDAVTESSLGNEMLLTANVARSQLAFACWNGMVSELGFPLNGMVYRLVMMERAKLPPDPDHRRFLNLFREVLGNR